MGQPSVAACRESRRRIRSHRTLPTVRVRPRMAAQCARPTWPINLLRSGVGNRTDPDTVTRREKDTAHESSSSCRLIAVAASVGMAAISSFVGVPSAAAVTPTAPASTSNPIEHVVVILEENHSFDNVLGKFCTEVASGQIVRPGTDTHCNGTARGHTSTGQVVSLSSAADFVPNLDHSVAGQQRDIAGGQMNGFSLDPYCSNLANCYSQFDPAVWPLHNGELHSQPFSIGHALHRLRRNVRIQNVPVMGWPHRLGLPRPGRLPRK